MAEKPNPKKPSSDYSASAAYWNMVSSILNGVESLRVVGLASRASVAGPAQPVGLLSQLGRNRRARGNTGSPYLPQFPNEQDDIYELRLKHAPLTNVYADISRNLASRPFAKECELDEGEPEDLKKLTENIDGQGNNLHVFARDMFKAAIDKGIAWVLIDYNKADAKMTLADERAAGIAPYWVAIPAERLLAIYSAFVGGVEVITHARIYECTIEPRGYDETEVERVREFNRAPLIDAYGKTAGYEPAEWKLHELQTTKDAKGKEQTDWVVVDGGPVSIGIIPMVPFIAGKRRGASWRVDPPIKDIAYMQIEEFQQESNLKSIKEMTAFPMLSGNGVPPPKDAQGNDIVIPVGPRAVLFAPPNADGSSGSWAFIEPQATSLTFLKSDLEALRNEMRDLGMQPLTASNLTVVTTKNLSLKAHSAVQAWAIGLKDALEQAFIITAKWMGQDLQPVVKVHTDFDIEQDGAPQLDALLKAEAQGVLSKATVQEEFKRRGVLSDEFDPAEEALALADQQQGMQGEQPIDPATGLPVGGSPMQANKKYIDNGQGLVLA